MRRAREGKDPSPSPPSGFVARVGRILDWLRARAIDERHPLLGVVRLRAASGGLWALAGSNRAMSSTPRIAIADDIAIIGADGIDPRQGDRHARGAAPKTG